MLKSSKLVAVFAVLVLGSAVASDAFAQRRRSSESARPSYSSPSRSAHKMAGCGLGSMAFEKADKWNQVGASLLNGTGMQTFAISFGTSNCTEDGVTHASREKEAFVEANLADLNRDMAVGQGEHISALANLYGCQGQARVAFASYLHQHSTAALAEGVSVESVMGVADNAVANGVCGG